MRRIPTAVSHLDFYSLSAYERIETVKALPDLLRVNRQPRKNVSFVNVAYLSRQLPEKSIYAAVNYG